MSSQLTFLEQVIRDYGHSDTSKALGKTKRHQQVIGVVIALVFAAGYVAYRLHFD